MPVLTISNGLYSNAHEIVEHFKTDSGCEVITDEDIARQAASGHGIKLSTIQKVIQSKQIAFNDFTHEKEKCIACLRHVVSKHLLTGNCLFHGFSGHLIPRRVSHVMRILIMTDKETRIKNAMNFHGKFRKEALKMINNSDGQAIYWTKEFIGKNALDESLYDIVIPTD